MSQSGFHFIYIEIINKYIYIEDYPFLLKIGLDWTAARLMLSDEELDDGACLPSK